MGDMEIEFKLAPLCVLHGLMWDCRHAHSGYKALFYSSPNVCAVAWLWLRHTGVPGRLAVCLLETYQWIPLCWGPSVLLFVPASLNYELMLPALSVHAMLTWGIIVLGISIKIESLLNFVHQERRMLYYDYVQSFTLTWTAHVAIYV